ncbi:hypothetical protein LEP1GSC116_2178 [Leptospira interrogans serovar Icterohaemorrhagiae str. Verdun HP]|uniref:Uncharacterized protein n=3 Tax=Leptospira interrogans TaxID=173 RepID=M6RQL3_LEPIR|nr:hypothetical protein LEP1GSC116_2178 [Leptospira interrogans serovar Icterohaemorrhagiae str. Verdun HP]EMY02844.1 hypothetical protein LEP1GSC029_5048 [Leptospira interrogans str. 2002000626]EMY26238.1 hypothetical protein LEP1GSC115_3112 [Leptospira interrogans serovar Australis str. 200703203]
MRSLIVRFKDCEGPGILLNSLKKEIIKLPITTHTIYE